MSTGPDDDPAAPVPDAALIAAIAERADRAAFAELFQRYAGRLTGFLVKGGAAREAAEEIAQDVMVAVWRRARTYDPAKAGVATWIFTIARNRRIDHYRRESRPEPDPSDPLFEPDPEPAAERTVVREARDRAVRAALAELGDDQRRAVALAFFAGLSHAEIAERLDVPLGTVKSRLRLAFGRLRAALGDGFAEELADD